LIVVVVIIHLIKLLGAILTEMTEVAKLNIEATNCVNIGVSETIPIARDKAGQHSIAQFGVVKNVATCPAGEGE